ncbi:uncharacterized protein JCM6883_007352 [Sporobolomyces salmoneus]|uniref:uncharacterized protein n=1 Tax=Sporobolomyces salmoneus TaxID=183962 RepID=UPI0031788738
MSRSSTPRPAFDSTQAAGLLKSAFQAELEAVHRAGPGPAKAEVYKAPNQSSGGAWGSGGGGWAQKPTNGLMADGKDFAQALATSLNKAKQSEAKK